jgi:hypothetical protein
LKRYTLDLSYKQQKEIGFRYDPKLNEYVYEFPVYLYKGRPNLVCKLGIKEDNNEIWYQICNTEGRTYHPFYVRNYGENKIVSVIDKNIEKQLRKLGAKRIKEIRKKYGKN